MAEVFDIIVVGGGINGCGIARDAALRGLKVVLVEKDDFAQGTSGGSSGMIHGGPRYLLSDVGLTRISCLDSGYIQKIAPHLLFRIPFVYPVYAETGKTKLAGRLLLEMVEGFFSAYDRFVAGKNGKPHTRLTAHEALDLEPALKHEDLLGAVTFDEWGIHVQRLCVANLLDAARHGAIIKNHTAVCEVLKEGDQVVGIKTMDTLDGTPAEFRSRALVNATGPWSSLFGRLAQVPIQLRPGKGIHLVYERRLTTVAINTKTIDGREVFIMPYDNTTIVGTTDDDYFGDIDSVKTTEEEIEYLLEAVEQVLPAIRSHPILRTYWGVRPTPLRRQVLADDLSREHEIYDHGERDGVPGLFSIVGGKLASYRLMSQEVVDLIGQRFNIDVTCATHRLPLPGGERPVDVRALAAQYGLDPWIVERLVSRHGTAAEAILAPVKDNHELAQIVCECEPVLAAEIRHVMRYEWVRTLSDLRRRTSFSLGPCQGLNCLTPTLQSFAAEKDLPWGSLMTEANRFNNETWWSKAICLSHERLRQETIHQMVSQGTLGLSRFGG